MSAEFVFSFLEFDPKDLKLCGLFGWCSHIYTLCTSAIEYRTKVEETLLKSDCSFDGSIDGYSMEG